MAELTGPSVDAIAAAAAAGASSAAGVPVETIEVRRVADLAAVATDGHIVAIAGGGAGRVAIAVPADTAAAEAVATGAAGAAFGALGGGGDGAVQIASDLASAGFDADATVAEIKALVDGTEAVLILIAESVGAERPTVAEAAFPDLGAGSAPDGSVRDVSVLSDVSMTVTVELGRTSLRVRDLLGLSSGSVVELDQRAGAPVDILVNGTSVARGDVVVIDEELGVRITEVLGGV